MVLSAVRERSGSLVIPHHARGARLARQRLTSQWREMLPAAMVTDAVTVVGELLGNAVRHAEPLPGGVIRLDWRIYPVAPPSPVPRARARGGGQIGWADVGVEVRVTDGGSTAAPGPRVAGPDAVDGRGLAIVAALARRWGVVRQPDGQAVWAELGGSKPP